MHRPGNPFQLPLIAALSALAWLAFLIWQTLRLTGGSFDYPLDDTYIHLAMAEGILSGTYGINPGEAAAASSSPLWPFLLAVLGAGRFAPLVWNALGLALAAGLWGGIVGRAGFPFGLAVLAAGLGPIALNMPALAFLGMEHAAHLAMALALFLGLLRAVEEGRGNALLWAGAVIGPALRFEALAFAEAAALVLAVAGHWRLALGVAFAALAPLALFAGFLIGQGLDPLPASVAVKMGEAGTGNGLWAKAALNLSTRLGMILAGFAALSAVIAVAMRGNAPLRALLAAVALALIAHLALGKIGWAYRYENYAIVLGAAAMLLGLGRGLGAQSSPLPGPRAGVLVLALLGPLLVIYWPNLTLYGPQSARGLYLQQTQMARLSQAVWKGPVAANDIGRLAWNSNLYVADLWGLASPAAFADRMNPRRQAGWADPLLADHEIGLALIYAVSLPLAPGPGWVRLGSLDMDGPAPYLAGLTVDIFATHPDSADPLRDALGIWAQDLPEGAVFISSGEVR